MVNHGVKIHGVRFLDFFKIKEPDPIHALAFSKSRNLTPSTGFEQS